MAVGLGCGLRCGYICGQYVYNYRIAVDKISYCPALYVRLRPRCAQFCAFCDLVDSRFPLVRLALRAR